MTADSFLSVADVAKQLGVAPGKVRSWIDNGELVARNLATTTATRPVYRITPADLAKFLESRASMPQAVTPAPRRRREAYREFV